MNRWYERVPLMLAAAVLLLGGAAEEQGAGQQMLAAGFVVLGAWVGSEVRSSAKRSVDEVPDGDKR
jgi:disulfide bond formation protein DsbB